MATAIISSIYARLWCRDLLNEAILTYAVTCKQALLIGSLPIAIYIYLFSGFSQRGELNKQLKFHVNCERYSAKFSVPKEARNGIEGHKNIACYFILYFVSTSLSGGVD